MEQSIQNAVLIQNVSLQDLERMVKRAVAEQMANIREQLAQKEEKKEGLPNFFKRIETARMLGVSLPTLAEWTRIGIIKCHRIGYRVYYTEDEIMKAMGCKDI